MKLRQSYAYSLNSRILAGCAGAARLEPNSPTQSLVAVSTSNTVIIKGTESSLHISDRVRSLAFYPLEDENRDAIVIGTDGHIIVYDPHDNVTLFRKEVPDGINCFAVGQLAAYGRLILCGGNCAIWGFDIQGNDVFWTVTGDEVTALGLVDFDKDEEQELIVGSKDYEIRIFKGDLMREEIVETDVVTAITAIRPGVFAYTLANGSVGVYDGMNRLWRTKSKVMCAAIVPFPNDECLACFWEGGKFDIRNVMTGEEIIKEPYSGHAVAAFQSRTNEESQVEMTIVFNDGKVRGIEVEQAGDNSIDSAQLLREFGQKKHNLLVELNNYEQEEQMAPDDRDSDFRIPGNTTVQNRLNVNKQERRLEIELLSTNEIPIRGCIILAEGIFEGESHVALPDKGAEASDHLIVPLAPLKDHPVELHIRTYIGNLTSDTVHVMKSQMLIPRFARFAYLEEEEAHEAPGARVELQMEARPSRVAEWVRRDVLAIDIMPEVAPDAATLTMRFMRLKPCEPAFLVITVEKTQIVIEHDDMETASSIVQSLAEFLQVTTLRSHAVFPREIDTVRKVIDELERTYAVRDRLSTEISEKHALLKEMILRAEDSVAIDHMVLARKYYTRLRTVERAVHQDYMIGAANQEKIVTSLRTMHKIIQMASKLRVGESSRSIIAECRKAVANDNLTLIPTIIEFGST